MKKIIIAATLILVSTFVGMAQSVDKALHNGKWYSNGELGSNKITLSKTAAATSAFDMELIGEAAMTLGNTAKADFVNNEGGLTKAGSYYVEHGYGYKITGNTIVINFQPSSWTYNITAQKNGDLFLEIVTPTNKSTK
ncbi:MAG: hypothetical protein IPG08_00240 [Sphingobacteriaceae bacterium]|nr:hypothetical protein [Sphingobacteriaceae bacterium]